MRKTIIMAASLGALALASAAPTLAQAPDVEPIFKAWDTNSDGVLTKGEWLAAGRQEDGFSRVDTDRDGKVSLAELKAAVAKMQGEQPGAPRGGAGAPDTRP